MSTSTQKIKIFTENSLLPISKHHIKGGGKFSKQFCQKLNDMSRAVKNTHFANKPYHQGSRQNLVRGFISPQKILEMFNLHRK